MGEKRTKKLLLLVPGILWGLYFIPYFENIIYLSPLISITSFIIFWNFPIFVTYFHMKPIYYDDIINNISDGEEGLRKKISYIFTLVLTVSSCIILGTVVELWSARFEHNESILEIIGLTGGLLSIYSKFVTYFGKFLLFTINKIKNRPILPTNILPSNSIGNKENSKKSSIYKVNSSQELFLQL